MGKFMPTSKDFLMNEDTFDSIGNNFNEKVKEIRSKFIGKIKSLEKDFIEEEKEIINNNNISLIKENESFNEKLNIIKEKKINFDNLLPTITNEYNISNETANKKFNENKGIINSITIEKKSKSKSEKESEYNNLVNETKIKPDEKINVKTTELNNKKLKYQESIKNLSNTYESNKGDLKKNKDSDDINVKEKFKNKLNENDKKYNEE